MRGERHVTTGVTDGEGLTRAQTKRAKLGEYVRKQLLREVGYVADTRTALKAFRGAVVRRMMVGLQDRNTPQFELELLLRAQLEGAKLANGNRLFVDEHQRVVRKERKDRGESELSASELTAVVARSWRHLSDEDQYAYSDRAAQSSIRDEPSASEHAANGAARVQALGQVRVCFSEGNGGHGQVGGWQRVEQAGGITGESTPLGCMESLRQVLALYRHYPLPREQWREGIAAFVDGLRMEGMRLLVRNMPDGIALHSPEEYASPGEVSPEELTAAADVFMVRAALLVSGGTMIVFPSGVSLIGQADTAKGPYHASRECSDTTRSSHCRAVR